MARSGGTGGSNLAECDGGPGGIPGLSHSMEGRRLFPPLDEPLGVTHEKLSRRKVRGHQTQEFLDRDLL